MHDIQFNKAHHGKLFLFILLKSKIFLLFSEMIGYPFTLTPPSSSEDSPQSFNMHSPNHYILPTPYIISGTPQYEMSMTSMYNSGRCKA